MDPFLGELKLVPYNFAPVGWMFCDGSLLEISSNEALYSLIGTTYGGDGVNSFGLPDFRGQVGVSQGQSTAGGNYVIGGHAGTPEVTLTTQQLPSHNHMIQVQSAPGNLLTPEANYLAKTLNEEGIYASGLKVPGTTAPLTNTGGNQPHNNMQPYLALNYVIAVTGIYPSQN